MLYTVVMYCLLFASTFAQGSESEIYSHDAHMYMLVTFRNVNHVVGFQLGRFSCIGKDGARVSVGGRAHRSFSAYRARAATCIVKQ